MTSPPLPPPPPASPEALTVVTRPSRLLIGLLWGVTAGVLAQATLAGLFLSGVTEARLVHVPAPATTAVHVPLGVLLTVYSTVLAVALSYTRRTGR